MEGCRLVQGRKRVKEGAKEGAKEGEDAVGELQPLRCVDCGLLLMTGLESQPMIRWHDKDKITILIRNVVFSGSISAAGIRRSSGGFSTGECKDVIPKLKLMATFKQITKHQFYIQSYNELRFDFFFTKNSDFQSVDWTIHSITNHGDILFQKS